MSDYKISRQRRQFLSNAGAVAVAIPVSSLVGSRAAFAADLPLVDEKSPQAATFHYVEVSTTDGQRCDKCALYQSVDSVDGAGTCPLFQGSHVAATARCNSFSPKP